MKNKSKNSKSGFIKYTSVVIILLFAVFMIFFNQSKSNKSEKIIVKKSIIQFEKNGELTFQTEDGGYIQKIDIEIADNDDKRTRGLMDRVGMRENQGMLFLFPFDTIQSFWMKNTVIPLDIIFVNRDNLIVTIHKNTIPFDTGNYSSTKPASRVVEVNAGYTDKYGISVGDKIAWRRN